MRSIYVLALVLASDPVAAQQSAAPTWNQWRGPARDGRTAVTVPKKWSPKPTPIWKVAVGLGHASPLVDNGRVYVFARLDDNETVSALDLQTGKPVWSQRYQAAYTINRAAAGHGKGPKSTPILHGGRLYTLGITGVLSAFDASTGAVAWRRSFEKEFPVTAPDFGTAMSPLVDGALLIAHVGGPGKGALRAFDLATGQTKWSWVEDGPAYASPVLLTVDGVRQIVTQTQQHIVGVDVATGKTLWSMPFETPYVQNIVTPLIYKDTVILSGLDNATFAVRPVRRGAAWTPETVWTNPDVPMYMSSPVVNGDLVFGFSHRNKGQFFALDARSGKTLWTSPPRQGENAAIIAAGDVLLLLTTDAQLIVAKATDKGWNALSSVEVASSPTWAHPILLGDRILIKDEQTLALLRVG
jgi:outer membrane protein assembly factor BamB